MQNTSLPSSPEPSQQTASPAESGSAQVELKPPQTTQSPLQSDSASPLTAAEHHVAAVREGQKAEASKKEVEASLDHAKRKAIEELEQKKAKKKNKKMTPQERVEFDNKWEKDHWMISTKDMQTSFGQSKKDVKGWMCEKFGKKPGENNKTSSTTAGEQSKSPNSKPDEIEMADFSASPKEASSSTIPTPRPQPKPTKTSDKEKLEAWADASEQKEVSKQKVETACKLLNLSLDHPEQLNKDQVESALNKKLLNADNNEDRGLLQKATDFLTSLIDNDMGLEKALSEEPEHSSSLDMNSQ